MKCTRSLTVLHSFVSSEYIRASMRRAGNFYCASYLKNDEMKTTLCAYHKRITAHSTEDIYITLMSSVGSSGILFG